MDNNNTGTSDVQIDEHNLDRECINLPTQFLFHAHKAADAKLDLDEEKNNLAVVEADLSQEIREHPGRHGIEKETEKAIAAVVLTHPLYQKALKAVTRAKHKADMAAAVVSAMEHKKRSLTLLVELHGLGYYSSPKISQRGRDAVEEMSKRNRRPLHHKED